MQSQHQYVDQLDSKIRHAVLGNAGTLVSFRVGTGDAAHIFQQFKKPVSSDTGLMRLPNSHVYDFFERLVVDAVSRQ